MKVQQEQKGSADNLLPAVTVPKGGGAINGIGEKFSVNVATGTAAASVPLPFSPARNGFAPQLGLSYDSGSGNGPFGLGWSLSQASVTRKTAKGLPQYDDAGESDTFILSGAEDLVPLLQKDAQGNWKKKVRTEGSFRIVAYRPRTEGLFARIEKWTDAKGISFWKIVSKENAVSFYGRTAAARVAHPDFPERIFEWLLEESADNKGNFIHYSYKKENDAGIDGGLPQEHFRLQEQKSFNRQYLKEICYGNRTAGEAGDWMFRVVFDYGEHSLQQPQPAEEYSWPVRRDPFSSFLPGFELRTYRLCRRVLLFHSFTELGAQPVLVRSTDITYEETPAFALLKSALQTGYKKTGNVYESKSTPPVAFSYSEATLREEICLLSSGSLENLPAGVDDVNYRWVDLDGEGIDGILTEQGGAWYYKSNEGGGKFGPSRLVAELPSLKKDSVPVLQDIDSDGRKELVVMEETASGFYTRTKESWENFQPFAQLPQIDFQNPNLRFIDLNGDGFADILITEEEVLRWFPSGAKKGFEAAHSTTRPHDEQSGPAIVFADAQQSIYLADMTGDGLVDLVRVRNKDICYWPNKGYGRFGSKITMSNAPLIDAEDQFSQSRIRLADIDGTGTADVLYIGKTEIRFWINEAGNSWSETRVIAQIPDTDQLTTVQLADLMGTGLPCLVWSSPLPGEANGRQLKYIDLYGGRKPYLLNAIDNNLGQRNVFHYTSSTQFYLADKRAGRPWITRLSFPVHVVERTESFDLIAGAQLVTSYKYHHGYYDPYEREFRGFGMVEQTDAESFGNFSAERAQPYAVPPVLTKTWLHHGAYTGAQLISELYKHEYFSGDTQAKSLPPSSMLNSEDWSTADLREACRVLRGQVLRQEVYSDDGTEKANIPYTVSGSRSSVKQLQPRGGNKCGVYQMLPLESISYSYERAVADPRISHSLTLRTDEKYGVPLAVAQVVYPRRDGQPDTHPEQQQLHVIISESELLHLDGGIDMYLVGVPLAQQSFELTGAFPAGDYFDADVLRAHYDQAARLEFHEAPSHNVVQKRLLSWSQNFYWNSERSDVLAFGNAAWPLLSHHSAAAVFTPTLIGDVFDDGEMHASAAGYQLRDGYWWNPGTTIEYAGPFNLPVSTVDAFGNRSSVFYDRYWLLTLSSEDALQNRVSAEIDYRTLSAWKMQDPNGNCSEVLTDALGSVIAASVYGMEAGDIPKGDAPMDAYVHRVVDGALAVEVIISNPGYFLQDATTFFYYDLHAWMHRQEPPQFISLSREMHVSEENGIASPVHIAIGYSDGFGRSIQQKTNVEPGDAFSRDASGKLIVDEGGKPVKTHTESRWISSGRTVFNNKQKPVKQYEPFYTSTFRYETEAELVYYGVSPLVHYDPMQRVIRTDLPKGFFSKVEFSSWESRTYDVNDTILDSDYYRAVMIDHTLEVNAAERKALEQTVQHANTPMISYSDSLGRVFKIVNTPGNNIEYVAHTEFNISGQPLTQTDARQYELNKTRSANERVHNFRYVYDMSGTPLRTTGVDNGTIRALMDVTGQPHISITAKGFVTTAKYDALRRPLEIHCAGPGMPDTVVERMIYGEMLLPAEAAAIGNVRGRLIHHYDASGKSSVAKVSFKGEALFAKKQLLPDDPQQKTPDWSLADDAKLEAEVFTSSSVFDALGRAVISVAPDQSVLRPTFNLSGQLKKVSVNLRGAAVATDYVTDICYNDKGQREAIYYNNGTRTKYEYEPLTYRLISLCTTRRTPGGAIEQLQKLSYTYDPAGNITQITDAAQQTIFYNGEVVGADNQYVYNALYQLVEAHGREHAGQNVPYSQLDNERIKLPHKTDGAAMRRYCQRFVYDAAGNKTVVMHRSGENSWTRTLEMDLHSNRLLRSWFGDHSGEEQFSYDVAGNMQQLSSTDALHWNYRGELQGMSRGTMHSRYTYAGGQRIRKVVETDGLRKVRIYLGDFEIYREYHMNGNAPEKTLERESLHISDGTQRIVLAETKTFELGKSPEATLHRYQFRNHLGSAALEVDEHAQVISYEEYYPYGNTSYQAVRSGTEVPEKRYRYTGMERDAESGLNYHSARYYAPWMGRWISADPAGTVDGLNLYHYVNGNPVNYADVTGNETPEPMEWQRDEAKCQRTPAAMEDVDFYKLPPNARAEWIENNAVEIDKQGLVYDSTGKKIRLDFRPIMRYYEFQLQTLPYRSDAYYRVAQAYNRFLNQESLGQFPDGTLNAGKVRDEAERERNYRLKKVEEEHQKRQQAWEVFNGLGGAAAGVIQGRDAMTAVAPVQSNRPAIVEPQEPVVAPPVRQSPPPSSVIIGPASGTPPPFNDHKPDLVLTQPAAGKPRQGPLKESTVIMMQGLGLEEKEVMGRTVYQLPDSAIVRNPGSSKAVRTVTGERVNLHHLWGREPGALVELPESVHQCHSKDLHWMIFRSFRRDPVLDKGFNTYRKNYMKMRNSE